MNVLRKIQKINVKIQKIYISLLRAFYAYGNTNTYLTYKTRSETKKTAL